MSQSPAKVANAKQMPEVYCGLHFYPGVAEYREPNKEPYRIFLNEDTLRNMDSTFSGKPVYVRHVDEVNLDKLQTEADGYVIRSFYNESDGKHWVEFIIVSDKGHEAIRNGWKLSNAYLPKGFGQGGIWNGVEYAKEITSAEYEHLALVNDPRYNESIVLKKAQFQEYNQNKLLELRKVANAKETKKMFDFFKKTKVENSDLENTLVKLPKSGKEVSIAALINAADQESDEEKKSVEKKKENDDASKKVEAHAESKGAGESEEEKEKQGHKEEEAGAAPQMANMDHHVEYNGEKMPLKSFMAKHHAMHSAMKAMHDCMQGMKNDEEMDGGEKEAADHLATSDKTKRNDEEMDGGEKESAEQLEKSDLTRGKKNAKEINHDFFSELYNAPHNAIKNDVKADLDKLGRGQSRYGSGN